MAKGNTALARRPVGRPSFLSGARLGDTKDVVKSELITWGLIGTGVFTLWSGIRAATDPTRSAFEQIIVGGLGVSGGVLAGALLLPKFGLGKMAGMKR